MTTLIAHKREKTGTRNNTVLRTLGSIPGVLYGPKEPAQPIVVEKIAFEKAWKTAGESTVVLLSLDGSEKEVLIHDVSMDPVRGVPTHVDLYAIEKGKKVEVHVPLTFVGESPAEKQLGGTLVKVLHEVLIEALPKDLPHEIAIDISAITELDTPLHVKDITLPSGVTCLLDADEVVATVSEVKEVTDEESAPIDMSAIEVSEERGKKEEPAEE